MFSNRDNKIVITLYVIQWQGTPLYNPTKRKAS